MKTKSTFTIDGSAGEGGGQILRSALSLSMETGQAVRLENIRAGRAKSGLMRQHLTCVQAATAISNAKVEGDEIGSQQLTFHPGKVASGDYAFSVGTAGSTGLVLQTLLPVLLLGNGVSTLRISGGTHNPAAPSFDFLSKVFVPVLNSIGAAVSLELLQPGFYPAGGGEIIARIQGVAALAPLCLTERGALLECGAFTRTAIIPDCISERELKRVQDDLAFTAAQMQSIRHDDSIGPGNALAIWYAFQNICELFSGFAERNKPSEVVAKDTIKQVRSYLKNDAPVGPHLADQLLLPLALGSGGTFRISRLTRHFCTNADLIRKFLGVRIETTEDETGTHTVTIEK